MITAKEAREKYNEANAALNPTDEQRLEQLYSKIESAASKYYMTEISVGSWSMSPWIKEQLETAGYKVEAYTDPKYAHVTNYWIKW